MPPEPVPSTSGSLRRRWGRWLEHRDRCCHCTRKIDGGTHVFGFWFCTRHFNVKTIQRWSER